MTIFEASAPVDRFFQLYVDLSFVVAGLPAQPEVEVGERCSRCVIGTKTKSSSGDDICSKCLKSWRGRVCAFFDAGVGGRPDLAETRFLGRLEAWREVKCFVEPLPPGFDKWFWSNCLTTMFAYVDRGIGTVDNVVTWGRKFQPHICWSPALVRDSITIARDEVAARASGKVTANSDGWVGAVAGAELLGFPDPRGSGRRRAQRLLESGKIAGVENRSAGNSRKRLMAPTTSWLAAAHYAS